MVSAVGKGGDSFAVVFVEALSALLGRGVVLFVLTLLQLDLGSDLFQVFLVVLGVVIDNALNGLFSGPFQTFDMSVGFLELLSPVFFTLDFEGKSADEQA